MTQVLWVQVLGIALDATGHTVDVDQPENIALGISHKFNDHFRVMSDIIFKDWSDASFWNRFYHDQTAFSIGAELDRGPFTWRAGYGYANDPTKDNIQGQSLEGHILHARVHKGISVDVSH